MVTELDPFTAFKTSRLIKESIADGCGGTAGGTGYSAPNCGADTGGWVEYVGGKLLVGMVIVCE